MFPLKKEYIVRDIPISLDWRRIAARMGRGAGRTEGLKERILLLEGEINIEPSFSLRNYAVESSDDEMIAIEGDEKIIWGSKLKDEMEGILYLTVYSVTIGHLPDLNGDLDALIVDHIGSEAVEQTAKRMIIMLSDLARGYRPTKRRSPGYGDFSLDQQPQLLRFSGGENVGIEVTDNLYLLPIKSTTGIVGWRYEE